ncbi:aminotransferase [Acidihalobacter prosperus]
MSMQATPTRDKTGLRELEAADRAYVLHPSTQLKAHAQGLSGGPEIITGGKGSVIRDARGREFLDGFAGLYCVNIGYGRTEMAEAISRQAYELAYYHSYAGHSNEPLIELSERLIHMAPSGMSRVYYGLSGSDANETQIKLVWYYNNILGRGSKKKIISRHRAYHGSGVMTGSLTGLPVFHQAFDLPMPQIKHTLTPHYYRRDREDMSEPEFSQYCANELERMILEEGPDTIAAFIGEPVLGTGGIVPPPEGYWEAIQAVLRRYDILLIADEVITGFGRLGVPFGCERYGIEPDLITLAKGLTSAYAPLSAVLVGDRVWHVLEEGADRLGALGHGWTYSGHPLGTAAALANLDIIQRENLIEKAHDTGAYLLSGLKEALRDSPIVGEVRGEGMLAAVEFARDPSSRLPFAPKHKVGVKVYEACRDRGVLARAMPHGDILGFAPPFVLSRAEADRIVETTADSVAVVAHDLHKSGIMSEG